MSTAGFCKILLNEAIKSPCVSLILSSDIGPYSFYLPLIQIQILKLDRTAIVDTKSPSDVFVTCNQTSPITLGLGDCIVNFSSLADQLADLKLLRR